MMSRCGVLLPLMAALAVSGCDYDPAAMNAKIAALDGRVAKLEVASAFPNSPPTPPVPTVLWVQNPNEWPRASSF
jgi:hypothetical protein